MGEISFDKTSETELRKLIDRMDSVFEFLPIFSPNYKIFGKLKKLVFCRSSKSCYRNIFLEDEGHADLKKLNAEFLNEDLEKFTRETLISKMRQKGIVAQILLKSNFTEFEIKKKILNPIKTLREILWKSTRL